MVIIKCYFSGELIALSYKKQNKNNNNNDVNIELGKTNRLKALCMMEIKNEIIIIMVIFKCYFSGELIALSYKKKNNSGVNIELGKTNRLKALCMMEI